MDSAGELYRLINGFRVSQAIHVAASLGVSDHLADGPRTLEELAQAVDCDAPSLYRLLRALSTTGLYEEGADGRFVATQLGAELRSDADSGVRSWAMHIGRPYYWQAWGALADNVRTGDNAFAALHGRDIWDYRAEHPAESAIFDAAMTATSRRVAAAVLDGYDFATFATVADIGGGRGGMLAAILQRYPDMRGTLFDQPHVVADAADLLSQAGVAQRCDIVGGDLFAALPQRADAYLLKSILHDWPDDRALEILRVCVRAMAPESAILIIERVLAEPPHTPEAASAAYSDLNMMVAPGGQERTRLQYQDLLAAAGLRLTRIVPTTTDVSIVEARQRAWAGQGTSPSG